MAAATPTQIRAGLKTVIETVANVGTVHDYERTAGYAGDMHDAGMFLYTATSPDSIRGWQIHLASTTDQSSDLGQNEITHSWQIDAVWQVDDANASEKTFDDTIELVRTAFRADDTLGGVVASLVVGDIAGAQVPEHDIAEFAGVLCHVAILEIMTRHYLP